MGRIHTEETKKKRSEGNKGKHRSEAHKKAVSEAHKGKDPWNKGKSWSDEVKNKISISKKLAGKITEDQYNNFLESLPRGEKHHYFGKHRDEATKKKISEKLKGRFIGDKNPATRPEVRKKMSLSATGENNAFYGKHHSEATKKKISDATKLENSYLWKGGISFEPYCKKFNRNFKKYIINKFKNKCFCCGKSKDENIISNNKIIQLSIHHIDYNKNSICNGKEWAFVPLCASCHGKTNHNRWYWFNLLINYWISNNEINLDIEWWS